LGAVASVHIAVVSPLSMQWLGAHAFKSPHIVVPVPVYAGLEQVQV
jgi:hypothetical protein